MTKEAKVPLKLDGFDMQAISNPERGVVVTLLCANPSGQRLRLPDIWIPEEACRAWIARMSAAIAISGP
jgi:hypothetical protein